MFPYFVLVELYQNSNEGVVVLGPVYTAATLASAGLGMLLGFAADLAGRKSTFLVALAMLPVSTALLLVSRAFPVVLLAAAVAMTANLALYHRFFKEYRSPLSRPESAAAQPGGGASLEPADPPPPPGRVQ